MQTRYIILMVVIMGFNFHLESLADCHCSTYGYRVSREECSIYFEYAIQNMTELFIHEKCRPQVDVYDQSAYREHSIASFPVYMGVNIVRQLRCDENYEIHLFCSEVEPRSRIEAHVDMKAICACETGNFNLGKFNAGLVWNYTDTRKVPAAVGLVKCIGTRKRDLAFRILWKTWMLFCFSRGLIETMRTVRATLSLKERMVFSK